MEERGVWFCLLALAGRGRRPGMVEAHQDDPWEMPALASYLKCSTEILSNALSKLSKANKVIINDKGIISINKWSKYQTSYEKRKAIHSKVSAEEEVEEDINPYSPLFSKFWLEYPKKVCKAEAYKAWRKIKPDASLAQRIILAIRIQKKTSQWVKNDGEFIPYPSSWLNQRRWEDEVSETRAVSGYEITNNKPGWLGDALREGWKLP